MSLLTIPVELRRQILTYLMFDRFSWESSSGLHWYDAGSGIKWVTDDNDNEWGWNGGCYESTVVQDPSELLQAMPDLEVEALTVQHRATGSSILLVCRQLYTEAIVHWYGLNRFHFQDPWLLEDFSNATFRMGNHDFITSLSIVVDLWDIGRTWGASPDPALWKHWQDLFEGETNGRGLRWHFPGLKRLDIDFEPWSRLGGPADFFVDGQIHDDNHFLRFERPYGRQSGFDSFADTLRRTVRVERVRVFYLHDDDLVHDLEREMMGLALGEWPEAVSWGPEWESGEDSDQVEA